MNLRAPVKKRRGFTLIETVFSMGLLLLSGLAVVGAIIWSRHMMEINKQTLTAMNYARQMLELAGTNSSTNSIQDMIIMRFNDPGRNVPADVSLEYFPITPDGTVDWDNPTSTAIQSQPTYCRVTLRWNSAGMMGRERSVTMATIVRAGTL